MAYIFRCDVCSHEETLDMPCPEELHRNCDDCGMDGCDKCLPKGACEGCLEDREPNDRS